jgi:hypothetical protein
MKIRELHRLQELAGIEPPASSIRHIVGAKPQDGDYGEYNEPPAEGTPFTKPATDPFANVPDTDPRMKITRGPAALQGQPQANQDAAQLRMRHGMQE